MTKNLIYQIKEKWLLTIDVPKLKMRHSQKSNLFFRHSEQQAFKSLWMIFQQDVEISLTNLSNITMITLDITKRLYFPK